MFIVQAGWPVAMLSEQYRMHPAISAWPPTPYSGHINVEHNCTL